MRRAAIFGVGLIGGSFALALRKAGFTGEIIGVSSAGTIREAVEAGVIDRGAAPIEAAHEADLVYLAQPVFSIIRTLETYGPEFAEGAIVTDAGSTKAAIVDTARRTVRRAVFIGGHPMAGKEQRGVRAAEAEIFLGRKYILSPCREGDEQTRAFQIFLEWVQRIGSIPVILDPDKHDRLVAFTSHLPQLLSTALASVLSQIDEAERVAGPAALDLTRLAASPFDVWSDILRSNRDNIATALAQLQGKLLHLAQNIGQDSLRTEFEEGAKGAARIRIQEK
jgi:prephenate dehydrogenase